MQRYLITACLALGLLAAAASGAPAQSVNRVVAVVGDDLITSADLERTVSGLLASVSQTPGQSLSQAQIDQIRQIALTRLIEDRILAREAKRLRVRVSDAEVEGYIQRIKQANNISDKEFSAQLSRRGIAPEEYRAELRADILRHKMIRSQVQSKVVITDEQVADYLKKHGEGYQNVKQVRFRALFLKIPIEARPAAKEAIRQQAVKLRARAVAEKSMAKLAAEYSQGPGKDRGGEVGPLAVADLLPEMRMGLTELKPGQISKVIEVPGNYVFMQLIERGGSGGMPPKDVTDEVRAKLEREATEARMKSWIAELKRRVYVKVIN